MEMEGRGYSNLCSNTSEELFLKSWMENPIGMPPPTMDMLGFKNLSQSFRVDSEELFKSWLTNGENHDNPSSIAHRTRNASRRISTELPNSSAQQHLSTPQKRSNDIIHPQNHFVADDISGESNKQSIRNGVENGLHASNLYLAKAWFHSSQPMTRSRSSELRRRYVAMQCGQTPIGIEAMFSTNGVNTTKQDFTNSNGFNDLSMCDIQNQSIIFMSPSNSSSSTFNVPQMGEMDKVSSIVSMLKGTLERKKLANQIEKEPVDDNSNGLYSNQEAAFSHSFNRDEGNNHIHEIQRTFQEVSPIQVMDNRVLQTIEGSTEMDFEGFVNSGNPIQLSRASQEPSQSESSAAAVVVSSGFDACDGPINSAQTISICESSKKQAENNQGCENVSGSKDIRERIIDNLKNERKRGSLVQYGSVTSANSADKGDPTKKRRVERSRKMAEAKERNLTPAVPSDMQAVLKRCENLEKEVRSLKLNLSFMNRKDSDQTKKIEELEKQNDALADEKERLLEEIERIISETGRM